MKKQPKWMSTCRESTFAPGPVLLLCLIFAPPALAGTIFSMGNEQGYPGTTVPVPVAIRNSNSIVAAQFDLSYNAAKVTPGDLLASPRLTNHLIRSRQIGPGVRRTVVYS